MSRQTGLPTVSIADEWEIMGEHILLPQEAIDQLMLRENAIRYASVRSVSLASFVRGVRQV